MTPQEAAQLLELPAGATPEQIEARFLELRTKLEDKIAKAPTPGLKAKYRESLEQITAAFETLALAADGSALPVLQKQSPANQEPSPRSAPAPTVASPARKAKNSSKEFAIVAVVAVLLLGAGGWFVMKTRAENEEKARIAAEAKAETELQAQLARKKAEQDRLAKEAADQAEKERKDRLFADLRIKMAELEVSFDAIMRAESVAERALAELRSRERETAQSGVKPSITAARALTRQLQAQGEYLDWLRSALPLHPAKLARARAAELVAARSEDSAAEAVAAFGEAVGELQAELARRTPDLEAIASVILAGPILAEWRKVIDEAAKEDAAFSAMMARSRPGQDTSGYRRLDADRDLAVFVIERFEKSPKGIPADFPAAINWLEAIARQGDVGATLLMAELFSNSNHVPHDEEKMWQWLEKAADLGDAKTKFDIATKSRFQMLPWDWATRVRWLRAAAEAGHAEAQVELGFMGGAPAPEPLLSDSVDQTRQLAAAGGFYARLELKALEITGQVLVSLEEAVHWLRKAAAQDNPKALDELKTRGLTP